MNGFFFNLNDVIKGKILGFQFLTTIFAKELFVIMIVILKTNFDIVIHLPHTIDDIDRHNLHTTQLSQDHYDLYIIYISLYITKVFEFGAFES